ncbi:hypothetical protein [Fretibacterium fastidiosum]|uniref:hypothetical protein n=1 Tax=Fretibacterium fastidiosum TaxID=651822 RepID=UPI001AD83AFC|nr:hypothetical protein [Fretibacterium fastidiosum]
MKTFGRISQPVYRRVVRLPLHALLVRRDHPGLDAVHVPVVVLRHQLRRPLVLLAQEADQVRCVARGVERVLEVAVQDGLCLLLVAQSHVDFLNLAPGVVLPVVRGRDSREVGHPEPQFPQPRLHPLPPRLNVPQRFVSGCCRHIDEVLDERSVITRAPVVKPVEEAVLCQRHGIGPVSGLRRLTTQPLVLLLEVLRPGDDLWQVGLPLLQRVPQVGVDRVLPFRAFKVPYPVLLSAAVVDLLHLIVQGAQVVYGHLVERCLPKVRGVLLVQGLRKLRVLPKPLGDLRSVLQRLLAAPFQVVGGQELFDLLVRCPGDRLGARHPVDALDKLSNLSLDFLAFLELLFERGNTRLHCGASFGVPFLDPLAPGGLAVLLRHGVPAPHRFGQREHGFGVAVLAS